MTETFKLALIFLINLDLSNSTTFVRIDIKLLNYKYTKTSTEVSPKSQGTQSFHTEIKPQDPNAWFAPLNIKFNKCT